MKLTDEQAISRVKSTIYSWFINGINSCFEVLEKPNSGSPLLVYILVASLVDCVAGFYCGRTKPGDFGKHYRKFIDNYIKPYDSHLSEWLWDIRCNLVHDFTLPPNIRLTHNLSQFHNQRLSNNDSILNFENVFSGVKHGIDKYFSDAVNDRVILANFRKRASSSLGFVGPKIFNPQEIDTSG